MVAGYYFQQPLLFSKISVPRTGFEPAHLAALRPEHSASTNFATWAVNYKYTSEVYLRKIKKDVFANQNIIPTKKVTLVGPPLHVFKSVLIMRGRNDQDSSLCSMLQQNHAQIFLVHLRMHILLQVLSILSLNQRSNPHVWQST